jgi:hypothetical protein
MTVKFTASVFSLVLWASFLITANRACHGKLGACGQATRRSTLQVLTCSDSESLAHGHHCTFCTLPTLMLMSTQHLNHQGAAGTRAKEPRRCQSQETGSDMTIRPAIQAPAEVENWKHDLQSIDLEKVSPKKSSRLNKRRRMRARQVMTRSRGLSQAHLQTHRQQPLPHHPVAPRLTRRLRGPP